MHNAPQGDALPADRPIALSWGSRLILERLGLWDTLPATTISRIHVSQQKGFGRTLISSADHGIAALGYDVSYRDLAAIPELRASGALRVFSGHAARVERGGTLPLRANPLIEESIVLAQAGLVREADTLTSGATQSQSDHDRQVVRPARPPGRGSATPAAGHTPPDD